MGYIDKKSYTERDRGTVTHIRVHLLRILWREGRGAHTYWGPSIEDHMEIWREGRGGHTYIRVHLLRILW